MSLLVTARILSPGCFKTKVLKKIFLYNEGWEIYTKQCSPLLLQQSDRNCLIIPKGLLWHFHTHGYLIILSWSLTLSNFVSFPSLAIFYSHISISWTNQFDYIIRSSPVGSYLQDCWKLTRATPLKKLSLSPSNHHSLSILREGWGLMISSLPHDGMTMRLIFACLMQIITEFKNPPTTSTIFHLPYSLTRFPC